MRNVTKVSLSRYGKEKEETGRGQSLAGGFERGPPEPQVLSVSGLAGRADRGSLIEIKIEKGLL